uniref:Uncharacterized protein n=1 Tax=Anguilla anguilla TaxID=7936 RepID=A0A0E9VQW0_ANGAN
MTCHLLHCCHLTCTCHLMPEMFTWL